MKKWILALAVAILTTSVQAQILFENFEDATVGYTTSVPEFTDLGSDFFTRTNGSNISTGYVVTGFQGSSYFAAQDLDGEGGPITTTMTFSGLNIAGVSSATFSILMGEDDDANEQDWDDPDYFHIDYSIDGGTYMPLIWVEMDGSEADGTNGVPRLDMNFDGDGDGTVITSVMQEFQSTILNTGAGSTLSIRLTFSFDSGDEDIAIDNVTVQGNAGPVCSISSISTSNASACNANGTLGNSSDDYYTVNVTVAYANAPATGTLNLSGDVMMGGGALSQAITGSPQTFTGIRVPADGTPVSITASFSASPLCNLSNAMAHMGQANCSPDAPAAGDIVINEMYYNPCTTQGNDENFEFLELYNPTGTAYDISGFFFDGIALTFPSGTMIAPGEYVVVTPDTTSYAGNGYQVFQYTNALNNGGEVITLFDAGTNIIDVVDYTDSIGDGDCLSLSLLSPTLDNSDSQNGNWASSDTLVLYGTPGAENFPVPGCFPEGITFATQADVDNFAANYPDCTVISGDVCIGDCEAPFSTSNITNLNGLAHLSAINGSLRIQRTRLGSLLWIENIDLSGVDTLEITNNTLLSQCEAANVCELLGMGTSVITIASNASSPSSCNSQAEVEAACVAACPVPRIPTLVLQSPNSIFVDWADVEEAATYFFIWRPVVTPAVPFTSINIVKSSYTLEGLTAGTNYALRLRSKCGTGNFSVPGPVYNFTTPTTSGTCGTPTIALVDSITANRVRVYWNYVPGATQYRVQFRQMGDTIWTSRTSTEANVFINNVVAGIEYEYRVNATCPAGVTAYSAIFTYTLPAAPSSARPSAEAIELEGGLSLYPNPASELLYVEMDGQLSYTQVRLINAAGQVVLAENMEASAERHSLNVRHLPNGLYFVQLVGEAGSRTERVVIQR